MAGRAPHTKFLSEQARLEKNRRIRETGKATRKRRKKMNIRVVELKLSTRHLSSLQKEQLRSVFLEAKWLRNHALSEERFDLDLLKEIGPQVPVKTPDGVEFRVFRVLGGQMKQAVINELKQDLKSLSALKKKGFKVGRLRFAREVNSINLAQHNVTFAVNMDRGRVRVANIKGWMKAGGLEQLREIDEIGNAKLVQKPSGYYLKVTTFSDKKRTVGREAQKFQSGTCIGVDMGLETSLTLSDGTKINASFEETDRLRGLRKKMSRQKKGSANWLKTLRIVKLELERSSRRKDDASNKIVHELLKNETVFFQDENISSWKHSKGFVRGGKKVQSGVLGRVKAKLTNHSRAVMLDRWEATTATCVCGVITKHHVRERVFMCPVCGHSDDRDVHAAKNMIRLGRTETPVEIRVKPEAIMNFLFMSEFGTVSVKQEAVRSSA